MGFKLTKQISFWGLLFILFLTPADFAHSAQDTSSQLELLERAFIKIAEEVTPAVVNISTVYKVEHPERGQFKGPFKDFYDDFFEDFRKSIPHSEIPQRSLGSGVIVRSDGYILTNNHVIEKAQKIEIRLSDKTKFTGEVIGRDPKTDIAVVKIDPQGHKLAVAKLGDSDKSRVGQWAIAIGNPFGLDRTVTVGVVSATGRSDIGIAAYENFIQTDASINRGNSGGPLLNIHGEVIGINTAIIASGQGIGFAVPINMARNIMEQLIEHGEVVRGWLGIAIQPVTEELSKKFGVKAGSGALVGQVFKDDPADQAGVKVGDIVVKLDGTPVTDPGHLSRLVATIPPGKKVEVVIIRDKKEKTITVSVGKQKEEVQPTAKEKAAIYGMKVQELTPQLAKKFGVTEAKGVLVSHVKPAGPAARAGIEAGDMIAGVNHKKVTGLKDYEQIISTVKSGESILVLRIRGENSLYVVIEPEGEVSAE